MISIEEILNPSLGELEFDQNAHLFEWPSDLVEGVGLPIHTRNPETIEQKDITDWQYNQWRGDEPFPFPDRSGEIKAAPNISASELRQRFPLDKPQNRNTKTPKSIARPNQASAFNLRQDITDNPFLPGLGFLEWYPASQASPIEEDYSTGATWALRTISNEVLGFSLFSPRLVALLGVPASADTLYAHMQGKMHPERLAAVLTRFRDDEVERMRRAIALKHQRITYQAAQWVDACRLPVVNGSGAINEILTVANVATAAVAINKLARLAISCLNFGEGAIAVSRHLNAKH